MMGDFQDECRGKGGREESRRREEVEEDDRGEKERVRNC